MKMQGIRKIFTKGLAWIAIICVIVGLIAGKLLWSGGPAAQNTNAQPAQPATAKGDSSVAPGQLDSYYMFASGGQSGDVYVYGIPSMRLIKTIPVFTPDPRSGYGFTPQTKAMLGGYTWGDIHHPVLSETNGSYNGKYLYVNDKGNDRIGMVDLSTFETKQIISIPNTLGVHPLSITPDSKFLFAGAEYSGPIPVTDTSGTYAPLSAKDQYYGPETAITLGKDGKMSVAWQLKAPPFDYDLASAGKAVSDGWVFFSSYNSEEATSDMEVNSAKNDRDYVLAVNYKKVQELVDSGTTDGTTGGVKMIDPRLHPGLTYLIPTGKNPHGVDVTPDGRYICAAGKLDPIVTVFDFNKIQKAISANDFQGKGWGGLPVLNYKDIMTAEVPVGIGPLHTQFDNKGYAYTSLFVESAVTKWQLGTWKVVQKIPVQYNVGHVAVPGGDTEHPYGQWLVSLDKMSVNRYLPVGPGYPMNEQLIDISGPTMKLVREAPADREPHYATIIPANLVHPLSIYKIGSQPNSIQSESQAKVVRNGNHVTIYMAAIRSHFTPDTLNLKQGDEVTMYITNLEQQPNITHGFAIEKYNVNVSIDPGQTQEVQFTASKVGVYPFYCTDFCSALHEEMMGYMTVAPAK
jgi:nitrous-oxide reductase